MIHQKFTIPMETKLCPKCHKIGQRKIRIRYNQMYEEFDHYGKKGYSRFHRVYKSTCYIGNINSLRVRVK